MWGVIILVIIILLATVVCGYIKPVNSDDSMKENFAIVEKD